jgi:hypothetical protein
VTSGKAMEHWQEQGDEEDEQDKGEPQSPAERRQVCVPLELEAVWLTDEYVESACIPGVA